LPTQARWPAAASLPSQHHSRGPRARLADPRFRACSQRLLSEGVGRAQSCRTRRHTRCLETGRARRSRARGARSGRNSGGPWGLVRVGAPRPSAGRTGPPDSRAHALQSELLTCTRPTAAGIAGPADRLQQSRRTRVWGPGEAGRAGPWSMRGRADLRETAERRAEVGAGTQLGLGRDRNGEHAAR
jgi:hypothetical protein